MWKVGWILVTAALLALAASCIEAGRGPQGAGTPGPAPTPTVGGASQGDQAEALLARAVENLDQAKSYRFTVQAVHHWRSPEGQEYDWSFEGEGAAVAAGRFRSVMRGPADTFFEVKIVDGKVVNRDARGERRDATTAFGGPGLGAAPYTVISYLRSGSAQGQPQTASLNGSEALRLAFAPNFGKVAAMDASHKAALEKVQAAQGVVWVDNKSGRVTQEAVTVQSLDSSGSPQTATITLKFYDYDSAIEIN